MSVTDTINLPQGPILGSVEEVALAGPGYNSPHSAFFLRVFLNGDVSAGTMTITINFDPRWSSMIGYAMWECGSLADEKFAAWRLQLGANLALGKNTSIASVGQFASAAADNQSLWCPPPQMAFAPGAANFTPNLTFRTDNTDTEDVVLNVLMYNFQKDIQNKIPLARIHDSLPRGTST